MKRLLLLGGLFTEKSIAQSAYTVAGSAASAALLGFDIVPWIISALGASIVQVYKPPETRVKAMTNSAICIFLGGVVGPALASAVWFFNNFHDKLFVVYTMSFILATIWPWVVPVLFRGFINLVKKAPSFFSKND